MYPTWKMSYGKRNAIAIASVFTIAMSAVAILVALIQR